MERGRRSDGDSYSRFDPRRDELEQGLSGFGWSGTRPSDYCTDGKQVDRFQAVGGASKHHADAPSGVTTTARFGLDPWENSDQVKPFFVAREPAPRDRARQRQRIRKETKEGIVWVCKASMMGSTLPIGMRL